MKLLLSILISYGAIYLVILLHELGHSFFYWKYGCKENWLKVTVKPYLFFSTPRPVDEEKVEKLTKKQDLIILYAGILINLISALIGIVLVLNIEINIYYIRLFLEQFITLHLAEMVTYLVIGNIYLVSDMKGIAKINPKLRYVNLIIGIIFTVFYIKYLFQLPKDILGIVIAFNIFSILCMGLGRVIFTSINSRRVK